MAVPTCYDISESLPYSLELSTDTMYVETLYGAAEMPLSITSTTCSANHLPLQMKEERSYEAYAKTHPDLHLNPEGITHRARHSYLAMSFTQKLCQIC